MKIKNNIAETGIAETLTVLHRFAYSDSIVHRAQLYIPFPFENPGPCIDSIARGLAEMGKEKLLLLTPEIAVIEKLAEYNAAEEIIICLPYHAYEDMRRSVQANMPKGIRISFVHENEIPFKFDYTNAAVVAFGFSQGNHSLILSSTYRMMKKYTSFYAKKVVAYCGQAEGDMRPAGWVTVNTHEFFNASV